MEHACLVHHCTLLPSRYLVLNQQGELVNYSNCCFKKGLYERLLTSLTKEGRRHKDRAKYNWNKFRHTHTYLHFEYSHYIALGLDKEEAGTEFTVVNYFVDDLVLLTYRINNIEENPRTGSRILILKYFHYHALKRIFKNYFYQRIGKYVTYYFIWVTIFHFYSPCGTNRGLLQEKSVYKGKRENLVTCILVPSLLVFL